MEGKVYELRFYTFNLKGKGVFKNLCADEEFWRLRTSKSKISGIWETQLNGITEFFHIAEYEDLADLLRVRKEFEDPKYVQKLAEISEQYMTLENCLTVLAPDCHFCTDFSPSDSAVYELQTMKAGGSPLTLTDKATLVGRFTTLYGPLNTEYRLIRYADAQAAQEAAVKRLEQADEMAGMMESRLMVPMSASDMK